MNYDLTTQEGRDAARAAAGGEVPGGYFSASGDYVRPTGGGGGSGGNGDTGFNQGAAQVALQLADTAAQREYLNAKLALDTDDLAFRKAQQKWTETYQQAQLDQARVSEENRTALGVLNMGSNLRGPQNYLQYLRTFSNTPNGLKDVVNALAGRFQLGGASAAQPDARFQTATVGGLVNDLTRGVGTADQWGLPSAAALTSGSTWDPQAYARIKGNPLQYGLLQSVYDDSGRDFQTEEANYLASLPRYGQAATGRYRMPGV